MKNQREYTCEHCKQTLISEWSEEERDNEAKELWGDIPAEEQMSVCDDCFNHFIESHSLLETAGEHKTINNLNNL